MTDWRDKLRKLDALAADSRAPDGERVAARRRADIIRERHPDVAAPPRGPTFARTRVSGEPVSDAFRGANTGPLDADLHNLFDTFGGYVADAAGQVINDGGSVMFGTGEDGGLRFVNFNRPPPPPRRS